MKKSTITLQKKEHYYVPSYVFISTINVSQANYPMNILIKVNKSSE